MSKHLVGNFHLWLTAQTIRNAFLLVNLGTFEKLIRCFKETVLSLKSSTRAIKDEKRES